MREYLIKVKIWLKRIKYLKNIIARLHNNSWSISAIFQLNFKFICAACGQLSHSLCINLSVSDNILRESVEKLKKKKVTRFFFFLVIRNMSRKISRGLKSLDGWGLLVVGPLNNFILWLSFWTYYIHTVRFIKPSRNTV